MAQTTDLTDSLPFGLRRKPFQPTADPDFFFPGGQSGNVLDRIVAALRARRGVSVLTGEPGTGKTMVLRRALDVLATSSPLVPIGGNAPLDLDDLIALLGATRSTPSGNREEQLEEVQRRLRELAEEGRSVVLAIDEAQALDEAMLGHVISLLGRASAPEGLAALLLVGQPALASRLEARGIEIAVRCSLRPLRLAEVGAYIAHRSREAGREAAELFASAAVERIARLSGGVPRFVNLLCREALAAAERQGAERVEPSIVDAAAEDLGFARFTRNRWPPGMGRLSSLRALSLRHVARAGIAVAAVALLLLLPWLAHTIRPVPPVPQALSPLAAARSGMPDRATDASVEVGPSGAVESSREPQAVEPEKTLGLTAETPNPGPRVAGPRLPSRRSDTGKVALPPTRPGGVTGDGRTARAPRHATSPSSSAPIDRGRGQVLLLRVENGDVAGVLALLAAGESPDARDRTGFTPLMLAVIRGDSAMRDALLGRGASVNARNHTGQTPLMMAAINNNRPAATRLLDRGANVNAQTTGGWTALMYAAWKGYPDMVRLLLARGADASLRDQAGWSAQHYAAWRGSQPASVESGAVVTGIDNVEPSLPASPGHSEVLKLLTEPSRRR